MNKEEIEKHSRRFAVITKIVNWLFYSVCFTVGIHVWLQLFYTTDDRRLWLTITSGASVILAMIQLGFVVYAHKTINKLKDK